MKQTKRMMLIFLLALEISACSSDNSSNDDPQQHVTTQPPVGTWVSGDYFLSLSYLGGYYAAYLDADYIDSGDFKFDENKMVIECDNPYFNHHSTYAITKYDSENMTVTVDYTKWNGVTANKTMTFHKSSIAPSDKGMYATGQYDFNKQLDWWDSEAYFVTCFTTYNTGTITSDYPLIADYPLEFFYIGLDKTIYYQAFNQKTDAPTITRWNDDADTGKVLTYTFTHR